jgi:hypothetical protein
MLKTVPKGGFQAIPALRARDEDWHQDSIDDEYRNAAGASR